MLRGMIEKQLKHNLQTLFATYMAATGMASYAVHDAVFGVNTDRKFMRRLEQDKVSFTVRRYDVCLAWFSANWPDNWPWPQEIQRPPIAVGSHVETRARAKKKTDEHASA